MGTWIRLELEAGVHYINLDLCQHVIFSNLDKSLITLDGFALRRQEHPIAFQQTLDYFTKKFLK